MKTLNFSCIEILPSLLDKSKESTIRPAWKENEEHMKYCPTCRAIKELKRRKVRNITPEMLSADVKAPRLVCDNTNKKYPLFIEKPPRFSPKDKVSVYWNQKSKYDVFHRKCGTAFDITDCMGDYGICKCGQECQECRGDYIASHTLAGTIKHSIFFNKHLGTIEITKCFKIEMGKGQITNDFYMAIYEKGYRKLITFIADDLAKRDGFSSAEKLFQFFDKQYDLSSAKQFWVYRFRWL